MNSMSNIPLMQGAETAAAGSPGFPVEQWVAAFRVVADYYGLPMSSQAATLSGRWDLAQDEQQRLRNLGRTLGLNVRIGDVRTADLASARRRLPLVLELNDGQILVIRALEGEDGARCVLVGDGGLETTLPLADLQAGLRRIVILRPARQAPDPRVDDYIAPFDKHWLRKIVLRDLRPYGHVMLASLVANTLALSSILFSMQVYDRVVPSGHLPTLYVLFSGVLLAMTLDFILGRARTTIIDRLGKQADIRLSDHVFGHALRLKNRALPKSTGSFIAQLRELEHVREMLTSTTVGAMVDIPFVLIFLVVFAFLGGNLIWVPITAIVLIVLPGLLAQRKLRACAQEATREAALRNALLVEGVQGLEDIKLLQAEERFQRLWVHYNAVTAQASLKLRSITSTLSAWTAKVQGGVYATTIFVGAPLVINGDITTGTLVAMSLLGSRMLAPMSRVSQIMTRYQQARVGVASLNNIMKLPVDHPEKESRIHRPLLKGNYQFNSAAFRYGDANSPIAFRVEKLQIRQGEKIAVLGRNGAGKSTLLMALSGLLEPDEGQLLLDDVALAHIDPADVRRDVGMLTQNSRLFHGTVRDNILLGAPQASEQDVLEALALVGADAFVQRLPKGLDHVIFEGGTGLSGGQKQALLLARLIVRNPSIVLLDEPTAAMDEATERDFLQKFGRWCEGRTLVVATHRTRVLDLVDRLLVVDGNTVVRDGPRSQILKSARGPQRTARATVGETAHDR